MAVLLSCAALRKSIGARVLFDNFSLSLSDGDRIGLIGPNGSGKTTLLEVLAGNERPDGGTRAIRKQTGLRPSIKWPNDILVGTRKIAGILIEARVQDDRAYLLIGIGVTVFVIGLLLALAQVLGRSMVSAPLRRDLLGPRAALAIIVFVALILAVNLPTAFILRAAGVPYPATIGALAGAVVIFIGGPRLSRHLRRLTRTGNPL